MIIMLIGMAAGILSGMGVGGGMILIPALCLFCNVSQKTAQCVNLFYFIPTAVSALIIHIKNKNVEIKKVVPVILGGGVFSLLGAFLAVRIPAKLLGKLFSVFIFAFGIKEIVNSFKENK